MRYRMFRAADVNVNLAPVIQRLTAREFLLVVRIGKAQEIPRCPCVGWHSVRIAALIRAYLNPVRKIRKRTFTCSRRPEVIGVGKLKRKILFIHRVGKVVLVNNREGLSPIALAAPARVPHFIVYLALSDPHFFQFADDDLYGLAHRHAVEKSAVLKNRVVCRVCVLSVIVRTNNVCNRQVEMFCKLVVPLVAARNTHDGAGSISCQNVLTDPYRYLTSVKWIDSEGSCKCAGDLFYLGHTIDLRTAFDILQIRINFFRPILTRNVFYHFVLRSDNHKVDAKDRVGTRRENNYIFHNGLLTLYLKTDLCPR